MTRAENNTLPFPTQHTDSRPADAPSMYSLQMDSQKMTTQPMDFQLTDIQSMEPQPAEFQRKTWAQSEEVFEAADFFPRDRGDNVVHHGSSSNKRNQESINRQTTFGKRSTLIPHRSKIRENRLRSRQSAAPSESGGFFQGMVSRFGFSSAKQSSTKFSVEQVSRERSVSRLSKKSSFDEVSNRNDASQQSSLPQVDVVAAEPDFQAILKDRDCEWQKREQEFQNEISRLNHRVQDGEDYNAILNSRLQDIDLQNAEMRESARKLQTRLRHLEDENTNIRDSNRILETKFRNSDSENTVLGDNIDKLQAKLREGNLEKAAMKEEHDAFVRKQQEASFRQMESARWIPMEEGKVMDDLERLKRDMRNWAKGLSIKDIPQVQSLEESESIALRNTLENVAVLDDGEILPEGLSKTPRSSMLLLNALLAHSVYTCFFQSPFFIFDNSSVDTPSKSGARSVLEKIYVEAQEVNLEDAHVWRSQTLRLLMPPIRDLGSTAEKLLRRTTEDLIAEIADRQASDFLASPATHFINSNAKPELLAKVRKIFGDAAILSYGLWTRRTEMKCMTLRDLKDLAFDAESESFDPDRLVRYEDHEDHLKGKMVTLLVHPLLAVYGTDEAKDYDQGRVWAKGVVWLDSKSARIESFDHPYEMGIQQ